jgi:hypothetical protein
LNEKNYKTIKEIKEYLSKWRNTVPMDEKIQHRKSVASFPS